MQNMPSKLFIQSIFVTCVFIFNQFNVILDQDLSVEHLRVRELFCINIITIT